MDQWLQTGENCVGNGSFPGDCDFKMYLSLDKCNNHMNKSHELPVSVAKVSDANQANDNKTE